MAERIRFSKAAALQALDAKAMRIAKREGFDRGKGASQLNPKDRMFDEDVRKAVEYGRMSALEEFACSIEEGFQFEPKDQP
ncbi:hypothetical protein VLK31_34720 [Variovorax sp. H27-G14]|uniref:hypothetical protein n=1 Tax=Variovorax sp. H27-G14 TaxID=3111914 RepID=UPI0038FC4A7C